jgi:DNA invertase Pin-like site-specific DNA recombinase
MVAAIYARKSTDQSAVADEAKSVTRQIDHAKAYAARGGWPVPESRIFVDDGISGAEFANRPGFVRLMAALKTPAAVPGPDHVRGITART